MSSTIAQRILNFFPGTANSTHFSTLFDEVDPFYFAPFGGLNFALTERINLSSGYSIIKPLQEEGALVLDVVYEFFTGLPMFPPVDLNMMPTLTSVSHYCWTRLQDDLNLEMLFILLLLMSVGGSIAILFIERQVQEVKRGYNSTNQSWQGLLAAVDSKPVRCELTCAVCLDQIPKGMYTPAFASCIHRFHWYVFKHFIRHALQQPRQ